jgi:hypothetical protein
MPPLPPPPPRARFVTRWCTAALLVLSAAACGGADTTPTPVTPTPVTPVVPVAAALVVVDGDKQSGDVRTALPTALTVRATTSAGVAVSGASVTFEVIGGVATLSASKVPTGSDGIATTSVTLGAQAGSVAVKASLDGTSVSQSFSATVRAPEPDSTLAPTVYNPDWTDASHGNAASPDYTVVFPQAAVNTIEIMLTSVQWASIRANLKSLYGFDFGSRAGMGGGTFPDDDPDYVAAQLRYNGKAWKKVGFRLKGNSTLASAWGEGNYKLPFRLNMDKYEDAYPAIKNQRFFGFTELSFSPGARDASLIREKVAADVFRLAGVPAARTAFYRVFIDFGTGLRYCGVYTGVEVIDDTMVKDQFGETKGNVYKPESRFQTFLAADFEKKNNKSSDWADVQATITALNDPLRTSDAAKWRANLEAVFNVDHFLHWLAVNNAIVNWDSYGGMAHNHYLYNHSSKHLLWIPWDHNEALSGSPGLTGTTTGGGAGGPGAPAGRNGLSLSMNEVNATWPLIRYLIDDPVYLALYKAHLKQFTADVLSQSSLTAMLDRYTALVSPYAIGANGEQTGATWLASPAAFTAALPALKTHIQNRVTLVRSYVP